MDDTHSSALPWAGEPYSIKRHGITITRCDSEPVHTPGCIQNHGALLVLDPADLTIRQASENTAAWFGQAPERLLGRPAAAVVGAEGAERLRQALVREPVERNPLYVLSIPNRTGGPPLDLTLHTLDGVAILEFEATGRSAVRADYHELLRTAIPRLRGADHLAGFCAGVAAEFRSLTGLDRVMVYRFHPDGHGEVFAESRRADLPSWLGLHYPAEDIPAQVREIFRKIWLRPVPDAKAPPVELVPLAQPVTGRPLDLTLCALRGASVMYTEYLRNMGVAASLTLPIRRDGDLWGLIAGHHYTATAFPYPLRAACEFLAQVVSLRIEAVEQREDCDYRLRLEAVHGRLIAQAAGAATGLAALIEVEPNLLEGIRAEGAALFQEARWWRAGRTPEAAELDALAAWLAGRPEFAAERPVYATDALAAEWPASGLPAEVASGLLAVSLGLAPRRFLLWFRTETLRTVNWAGSPHDQPTVPGPHGPRLTPRASFDLYVESVRGRSLPWKPVEIEAALRLRVLALELVMGRAERLAALNAELSRSNEELDAFAQAAAHDLKEPLRGIARDARRLLEHAAALDAADRHRLEGLLRLVGRMDSLLDSLLHYSRLGRSGPDLEPVDLAEVVEEALEITAARRPDMAAEIVIEGVLPTLACDRARVREVFVQLIGNALKFSDHRRRVAIGHLPAERAAGLAGLPPAAAEQSVFFVKDDGLGIDAADFERIFRMFTRLHGPGEYGGGCGAGLAIARRLVQAHGGVLWVESAPGAGSTFYFTLGRGARPEH